MHKLGEAFDMDLVAVCLSPRDKWELSVRIGPDCDFVPESVSAGDTFRIGTGKMTIPAVSQGSMEWQTDGDQGR
jgi:hypothetical protein